MRPAFRRYLVQTWGPQISTSRPSVMHQLRHPRPPRHPKEEIRHASTAYR
jgi:hypothetical protein